MPKIPEDKTFQASQQGGFSAKLKDLEQGDTQALLPHIAIRALAGTGKTTTLIEGLRLLVDGQTSLRCSDQQADIWAEILKSEGANSFMMTAFNKEIADTLQSKLPPNRANCSAKTLHAIGLKALVQMHDNVNIDNQRSQRILAKLTGHDDFDGYMRMFGVTAGEVASLVGYCKINLNDTPTPDDLKEYSWLYALDIDITSKISADVLRVLEESHRVVDGVIDFNDMIWLPIVTNLALPKYDLLFVDEAQDLNKCQQELALRIGKRIVICADPNQAIYAFAGADSQSFFTLTTRLEKLGSGCISLPLTTCYRCSKAVIREAQKWVPAIQPYEDNPEGSVQSHGYNDYHSMLRDGDMIICRCNGPLVSLYFKLLQNRKKAYIRGRKDVAGTLVRLVKKLQRRIARDDKEKISCLLQVLKAWGLDELLIEQKKATPNESKIQLIHDKVQCIEVFMAQCSTVMALLKSIEEVFSDKEKAGICLSTIHQAKGQESSRVFFLMPKGAECPAPWAKTEEQREQESNLRYIGITRAIVDLIYVA